MASTPAIRRVQLSSNEIFTSGALAVARSVRDKKDLEVRVTVTVKEAGARVPRSSVRLPWVGV